MDFRVVWLHPRTRGQYGCHWSYPTSVPALPVAVGRGEPALVEYDQWHPNHSRRSPPRNPSRANIEITENECSRSAISLP